MRLAPPVAPRWGFLTVLLAACGPAPGTPDIDPRPVTAGGFPILDIPSAATHVQLHEIRAKYRIGTPRLPAQTGQRDTYLLDIEDVPKFDAEGRDVRVYRARIPFVLTPEEQRFAPLGMEVWIGGTQLAFSRDPVGKVNEPTWRVNGPHLMMSFPEVPPGAKVKVVFPGIQAALDRHDPEAFEGPDFEFVQQSITLQDETRAGLMLPAPSKATWDVDIPKGTVTFETWLAMEPTPLNTPASDGALVVLSVGNEGDRKEIAREEVPATTPTFLQWRVDVSEYAGKTVKLVLETRPKRHNHFDWVFLGSPALWGDAGSLDDVRRVVVLAMDTTRPDHFGTNGYHRDTTPNLDRIAEQSVVFDHSWSVAPRTRPSFRSATTGRIPPKAVGATNIGEMFRRNGFATAGIVANVHLQPRFDFDKGFDWWKYDGVARAPEQVERALAWLESNQQRDTYLFLHFMDPHLPYEAGPEFDELYVDVPDSTLPEQFNRWDVEEWLDADIVSEQRKDHIEGLHDAELRFMDEHIGRFFDALSDMPGRTLVLVHTDHGEEFFEHGGFEHNHTLYDELTRTILWLWPGGGLSDGQRLDTPASLLDIAPTLYDMLGFSDVPPSDGRSLAPLFEGHAGARWDRPLPIAYLQYDHERWGVVHRSMKYILHTGSGHEELYDLTADPEEKHNVASKHELAPFREALSRAHDIPVLPGWRVRIALTDEPAPFTLRFPVPAVAADVLDPEAAMKHRANLEWGEPPRKRADEVGTVTLARDRRSLRFEPGPDPSGILYVQFEQPTPAKAAELLVKGRDVPLDPFKVDAVRWRQGPRSITLDPGWVLVPPISEMALMQALRGAEDVDPEAMRLLRELGYVH